MIQFCYIDPATVSIGVTAIAGGAIAIGTAIVVFWRRAKRKAMEKLHLQEHSHKEVEDDISLVEEEKPSSGQEQQ